jgi:hypothetical protein
MYACQHRTDAEKPVVERFRLGGKSKIGVRIDGAAVGVGSLARGGIGQNRVLDAMLMAAAGAVIPYVVRHLGEYPPNGFLMESGPKLNIKVEPD